MFNSFLPGVNGLRPLTSGQASTILGPKFPGWVCRPGLSLEVSTDMLPNAPTRPTPCSPLPITGCCWGAAAAPRVALLRAGGGAPCSAPLPLLRTQSQALRSQLRAGGARLPGLILLGWRSHSLELLGVSTNRGSLAPTSKRRSHCILFPPGCSHTHLDKCGK